MFNTVQKYLLILGTLCVLFHNVVHAQDNVVIISNNSHFKVLHRIEAAIYAHPSPRPNLLRFDSEEIKNNPELIETTLFPSKLIVTIGARATKTVLETNPQTPILSILLREHVYSEMLQTHASKYPDYRPNITSIFLDQPLGRQLDLIQNIIKEEPLSVGVVLGPNSLIYRQALESAANKRNIKLHIGHIEEDENPVAILDLIIDDANVVLAVPDHDVFNNHSSRGILLTAYRKRVPLVGFSKTYVNNGALASVYSSSKQIANQVAELILQIVEENDAPLPKSQYPKEFSVAINYQVARSLGIDIDNEDDIAAALKAQEGQPKVSNLIHCSPSSLAAMENENIKQDES